MYRRDFVKLIAGLTLSRAFPSFSTTTNRVWSTVREGADAAPPTRDVSYYGVFREASPLAVKPRGWLHELLTRQLNGLARHHAASGYPYDTYLWASGRIPPTDHGEAWWPYEQTGYLVDGLERLGIVTGDAFVSAEAHANIAYILNHPRSDGSLGPDHIGDINWPHAVVLRAFQAEYAKTHDRSILEAMRRHYLSRPTNFGSGRNACNIEEMLFTYAGTGDPELLTKARQTYEYFNQEKPASGFEKLRDSEVVEEHGVTFNETAKLPLLLHLYTGEVDLLDATINAYWKIDRDHMLASGLHSAGELTMGNSPDLYHETCDISDYTWSVGYLLMATGDARWADHIEKAVFNAGLGAITKDFKAHQYFSTPNQIVAAQGIETDDNDEYRTAYRPGHATECCSGNVHRFLPNYVLRQWLTTPQGGIVSALFGSSVFTANVGGVLVKVEQETEYPFADTIRFTIHSSAPVAFPFHIRIPGWALNPTLTVNGKTWPGLCSPGSFETVSRTFRNGDRIELHLPMQVRARYWGRNGISIERGPLVYALKIQEDARAVGGFKTTADFPAWDIRPASAWNYGLLLKEFDIQAQIQEKMRAVSGFPWDVGNSPIELNARAKRILNWELPPKRNPKLPDEPQGSGNVESVTLVPYGTTRIRLTVFPLLR